MTNPINGKKLSTDSTDLIACHECDALQQVSKLPPGGVARCVCCRARLYGNPKGGLDTPLALMISSFILFLVANVFPIVTLNITGQTQQTTLVGASWALYQAGMPELAAVVGFTSVAGPAMIMLLILYVLGSLRLGFSPPGVRSALIWISRIQPWGMLDVFMLGILVSLVKLMGMADVVLGPGLYAYTLLIFFFAAATARLEPHLLWDRLEWWS